MKNRTRNKGCVPWLAAFAIGVLGVMVLFRLSPSWGEAFYGRIVYPWLRSFIDLFHLPIAGIYICLTGIVAFIAFLCWQLFDKQMSIRRRLIRFGKMNLGLLSVLLIWFYLFWGYNYSRPDIVVRMNMDSSSPDTTWLFDEIDQVIHSLNELRALPELDYLNELKLMNVLSTEIDVDKINHELEAVLPEFHYTIKIKPKVHFLIPDGFLLHWSTSGIYWPFTGGSNVDQGVHLIKKPVTVAHELAHAHGLTSEGDCNFVAYLACRDSEIPLHQYSAELSYLGYLMRDALKIKGRAGLQVFYQKMSAALKTDRQRIFDHHERYTDYFPKLRNKVYDTYLKSQGVKGGISSYNYFVKLKFNWDRMNGH